MDPRASTTNEFGLSPHQFGDQGTLFDAPLGQQARGTFRGNQAARIYRTVHVRMPMEDDGFRKSRWGHDVGGPDEPAVQSILQSVSRKHSDRGWDTNLGIHWQHDLGAAQDHFGGNAEAYGNHGSRGIEAIIEADHPGYDHIVDNTPTPHGGPPEGVTSSAFSSRRKGLTGYERDWAIINDTVGPHDLDSAMLPEVPVRPGAPMTVHAIHLPDPERHGQFIRNPVQFKGYA